MRFLTTLIALYFTITALAQQVAQDGNPELVTASLTGDPTSSATYEDFPASTNTEASFVPTPSQIASKYTTSTTAPHFTPKWPTSLSNLPSETGAAVIATLSAVMASWTEAPEYTSIASIIFLNAPSTSLNAQLSLAISGYNWDVIVAAPWYTSVPTAYQGMVSEQEEKMQEAFDAVTGTGLDFSSGAGAGWGKERGKGVWVVWVIWVVMVVVGGVGNL